MVKNHLKRIMMPKTWKVARKVNTFVSRPMPGAHKLELAVSINTFLKEMTGLTRTTKETKYLLKYDELLVNGARRRDEKQQVGFLDIVSLPKHKKAFIISINKKSKLIAKEIDTKVSQTVLKVTGKTVIPGGKIQINTVNGVNILAGKESKDYKIGDSLLFDISSKKIKEHLPRKEGAAVFIFTGKHAGKTGELVKIDSGVAQIKADKETFETHKEYVIVIGKKKPVIDL